VCACKKDKVRGREVGRNIVRECDRERRRKREQETVIEID